MNAQDLGCWEWQGHCTSTGYGVRGPIPEGPGTALDWRGSAKEKYSPSLVGARHGVSAKKRPK
jgi:hypothetical protein